LIIYRKKLIKISLKILSLKDLPRYGDRNYKGTQFVTRLIYHRFTHVFEHKELTLFRVNETCWHHSFV